MWLIDGDKPPEGFPYNECRICIEIRRPCDAKTKMKAVFKGRCDLHGHQEVTTLVGSNGLIHTEYLPISEVYRVDVF